MTVRAKLNLLLIALTGAFLLTLAFINANENQRMRLYLETIRARDASVFGSLIALRGASLRTLTVDYTYWDDMVRFVSTGDRQWAKENLETALATFDAHAIWVFRADASFVHSVTDTDYRRLSGAPLPADAVRHLLAHGPFSHFYVSTRSGPMEVFGATIHPTGDPNRKTSPRGYLLAGRVWNDDYVKNLAALANSEIRIRVAGTDGASPLPAPRGVIRVSQTLPAWDGRPLLIVEAERTPAGIRELQNQSGRELLLLIAFGLITVATLTLSLVRWVSVPLSLITKILDSKDPGALERLAGSRSEFGHLAEVIRKFFAQSELIAETTKRRQVEQELRVSEERSLELVQNASEVVYTHDLDGRVTSINPAGLRLLDYAAEDVPSLTIQRVLAPEYHRRIKTLMHATRDRAFPSPIEVEVVTRDGRRVALEISVAPMYRHGERVGLQGIGRDITERKEAESRVRSEAARSEALLSVAGRLNATLDLESVLANVCEDAARALNVPAAAVRLYDSRRGMLRFASAIGLPPGYRQFSRPFAAGTSSHLFPDANRVLVIPDVRGLPDEGDNAFYEAMNIHTAAMVLLERDRTLIGSLDIFTIGKTRNFSRDDLNLMRGVADQATLALANARLFRDAQRQFRHLEALRTVDIAIGGSVDMRAVLSVVLTQVILHLQADAASLLLLNPHTQTLEFAAGDGLVTSALRRTHLKLGQGHAGRAALTRRAISVPSLSDEPDSLSRAPLLEAEGVVTYYALPLIAKGAVKGVLEIFHRSAFEPDSEWVDFVDALGGQAAIAIDGARLFNELQQANVDLMLAYDTTLEGWSRALELRDEDTEGHTQRVTELAVHLARALGIPDVEIAHLRRGALLHDIGKMGVPDAILRKPGPLTEEEWTVMRRHPVHAYEMLAPIGYLRSSVDIPYCHHELWDGSGYPRGLKGRIIPLAARIFAVVDVWDALRSDRPYRRAWSVEKTRAYLLEQAGKRFDPEIVEAFLRLETPQGLEAAGELSASVNSSTG